MSLSERLGIKPPRAALQGRSLDSATRNRLWSTFATAVPFKGMGYYGSWVRRLYVDLWSHHFKLPVDEIGAEGDARAYIKSRILHGPWNQVYDLLEYIVDSREMSDPWGFQRSVDRILAEELAGFRLLDGEFAEVTDEGEIAAIEEALANSGDRFSPAREHLKAALSKLSDRQDPDYRNSIKESISAVEAVVQILTGDPAAELGKALKLLEDKSPLHGALRSALTSLYGYTSDADGIRHALTEDDAGADGPTAKFMLVVCSAFVVFLIQRAADEA